MPRRLITQPPLLLEAGWESQQVLRVRVWTHVTQMCTAPGSHPLSCLLAWDGWDSASACVCLRLFGGRAHTRFFEGARPARDGGARKLSRAELAGPIAKRLPACHHANQHAVIVKPLALLKVLCRCARKRATRPPDCDHGGQRLRGVHAQLGRRAACPRAERVCDCRSRPADLVAAARGRAEEPCSALRRAVTHWQAAASRELV